MEDILEMKEEKCLKIWILLWSGQPDLFALDLKVESFSTNHPSGLKSYFKGRVLKWVVDRKSLTVDAMRFQAAYAGVIASMTDKSEWPEVDLGFKKTCKLPFKLDDEEEEEPDDGEQEKPDDVEKQENPDDGEQQGLDDGEQKASEEVDPAPKEVQPATKRKKGAAKSQTKGAPPAKIGGNKMATAKSPTQGASQAKGKKNIASNSTKTPAEGKKKAAAKSPTKGGKRKPKGTTPTKESGSATITNWGNLGCELMLFGQVTSGFASANHILLYIIISIANPNWNNKQCISVQADAVKFSSVATCFRFCICRRLLQEITLVAGVGNLENVGEPLQVEALAISMM
ncbi:hypothetical protein VPH35_118155 [Triticum aestivum]|uniref:Uncharacterized protein n=1 Tax=Aegilops tauschii TaxID=37682 RepID=N1QY72_AEGTA